ncbi:DNA-binding transcriptional regulator, FrmR family [Kytococcus aerolatus]|uniref:DNA-binding transcriptional regulator, FrmR family n=1 Tax=Kytococcus aerolatus TaxID=592308 RepID=A0A212TAA2_9MICO|nr:metal-sensitive transcriptional regulator [Kytococcus aerolatus]SNC62987.1 DNA-binding transcriptional regulator, FrmR family [Kytococcus aerolatus]
MHLPHEETASTLNRLRRARGQLDAVIRMLEEESDCRDVMTQLAAASKALDRAGFSLVATGMRHCLLDEPTEDESTTGTEQDSEGRPRLTVEQMEKLFLSLT